MMSASVRTKMGGFSSPTGMCDSSKYSSLAFLRAPPSLRFGSGGLLWSNTLVTSLCHVVEDMPEDTRDIARRGCIRSCFYSLVLSTRGGARPREEEWRSGWVVWAPAQGV